MQTIGNKKRLSGQREQIGKVDSRTEREKQRNKHAGSVHSVLSAEARQETPFRTLSQQQWQELCIQVAQCLEDFASAAREQRLDHVLKAGQDLQEVAGRLFLEAYVMSADLGLRSLST